MDNARKKEDLLITAYRSQKLISNYFTLLSELHCGNITEDQFNKEIKDHEGKYVLVCDGYVDDEIISLALSIIEENKDVFSDVKTVADLAHLFMLDEAELNRMLNTCAYDRIDTKSRYRDDINTYTKSMGNGTYSTPLESLTHLFNESSRFGYLWGDAKMIVVYTHPLNPHIAP